MLRVTLILSSTDTTLYGADENLSAIRTVFVVLVTTAYPYTFPIGPVNVHVCSGYDAVPSEIVHDAAFNVIGAYPFCAVVYTKLELIVVDAGVTSLENNLRTNCSVEEVLFTK